MGRVVLSEELNTDYRRLFASCVIDAVHAQEIDQLITQIVADRRRYRRVAAVLEIPWFVVAAIHYLETGRNFDCHLHNGDPLTERTVHLPDGRPEEGQPPFTWEVSAVDALKLRFMEQWEDWSVPGVLFQLEGYNGWGYRLHHPEVRSPYLWSWSSHYEYGRYIADGTWSESATAGYCGAAVLLRRMAERGLIRFEEPPMDGLPIRYVETGPLPGVADLQVFLNRFPGVFVRVDGWPGLKTSAAFRKVFGRYLSGDPREADADRD